MRPTTALPYALLLLLACGCSGDADNAGHGDDSGDGAGEPGDEQARRGGNSGSEGSTAGDGDQAGPGGDVVACPCNAYGTFARATVVTRGAEMLELRIEEVIHGSLALSVGQVVQARFAGRMPCYRGVVEVAAGDELLAVFNEHEMLSAERYVDVRVTHWDTELLFAENGDQQVLVPAARLEELWDNPKCFEDFDSWADLYPGGQDGTSDERWCVEDGEEVECGGAGSHDCDEPECVDTPPCEDENSCPSDMRCEPVTERVCPDDVDLSCMAGEPDDECAARADVLRAERCQAQERMQCVPFWLLDCDDDANANDDGNNDCPEGFACVESACEPIDPNCEVDADCAGRWLCRTIDGGYCEGGDDCVGNQLQRTTCVPPRVAGDQAEGDARGTATSVPTPVPDPGASPSG